jgi:gliding motility-associated-like protein
MKIKLTLTVLIAALLAICKVSAQDFSNKGKDFWITYPSHIDATASVMGIYITSDVNASGQISYAGTTISFTVTANQVTRKFLGSTGTVDGSNTPAYLTSQDGIKANAGIHITSDKPVVVYAHIIRSARSGATLALPVPVLGTEYIIPSYQNLGASASFGELAVVATQANTVVEITPTINGAGGRPAGTTFQVTLSNPGDVYQFQGVSSGDLSGTKVKSIGSGTGGCKPIAVFSATTWSAFDCSGSSGGDNLFQQLFPNRTWGKQFVTAPFINRPYDVYRIFVQDVTTQITKTENGVTTALTTGYNSTGKFYEVKTSNPIFINADKPISVVQYIVSQTCKSGCGTNSTTASCYADPEMVILNPIEQTLNDITFFSAHQNYVPPGQTAVQLHFVNIIINKNYKASVRIDNLAPGSTFVDIPGTNYSYLQENVTTSSATNPVHRVTADTTFTAIVYGYGSVESYGYNGGTNVKDLYQFVSIQNQYATVSFPAACKSSPFYFSMTFPYQPTQIQWQFSGLFPDVTINGPVYDSTWTVNGKQLYRYKLLTPYTINTIGTYPIKVIAQNPTSDGCSGEQEINYDLQVFERPVADFNFTATGCVSDSVHFFDNTNTNGRPVILWSWSFGDGGTSTQTNPSHLYTTAGAQVVKFSVITDIGCLSDTIPKTITLSQPPVAKFGISYPNCVGKTITFSDSSSTSSSTIVKWTWDFGDGSPVVISTTNASQTHTYAAAGTYNNATLLVETATGCKSLLFGKPVVVSPNPVAGFNFGNACLPVGNMQFTDASTIADGTQSQFIYSWKFGDGGTSILQSPAHTYANTGPFNVTLIITSGNGCIDSIIKNVATVYAQPQARFGAPSEVCDGTTVNFSDSSFAPNNTITQWQWDFGDGNTSALQNPTHVYAGPGTYTIKLTVTSAVGCVSVTTPKTIIVNSLPSANFTVGSPDCVTKSITFTDNSTPNSGTLVKWTWNFGDGTAPVISPTNAAQTHTYAATGTYTVTLVAESSKGCVSASFPKQVVIHPLPVPGFAMPANCLADPFSQFFDTTSIADGSQSAFTYLWNFGDPNATGINPNTSTLKNPKHKYSVPGPYPVTLTVTSNNGCTASITQTFILNGTQPQSSFVIQGSSLQCSNDSIRIKDNSFVDIGNVVKLEIYWDYANDPTNKVTFIYPAPGTIYSHSYPEFFSPATKNYVIRVIAYSGDNCLNSSTQTVSLKATPDVYFTTINSVCADVPSFLLTQGGINNAGVVSGGGVYSGNGVTASGQFAPATAGVGTHTIRYTYTGANGCSNYKEQTITVYPVPTVSAGPDRFVLEGGNALLLGTGTGISLSYLWTPALNLNDPLIAQPITTPTDDITYTLKITSADGCTASDEVYVKLLKAPSIPNVFSPNGDGINDKWEIKYLESYPGCTIEIYNRYGQLTFQSTGYGKAWDGTYKGKPVPAGTYYYIINPKNGRQQMSGFVDVVR